MARIRRSLELALLLATQAKFPPQPDDPVTTGVESLRDQFRLQTQWPVGFTSLDVGSLDGDLQSFIVLRALRWRAVERRIKSAARHIEDAAQQAKRVFESHRLHERVPGSDSLAKYAVAFFRTSFSIRSTASSLRSLATSASSSATLRLPGGAFGSVPRLAALTQLASVPLGIKIRCAASSSVNPCASTSLTASARNSGVYVVDFMFSLPLTSLSNGSVRKCQATSPNHVYKANVGCHVRSGRRQSIPSSSIESWAWLSVTLPLVACGQTKRPFSSRLASRHSPSPVHQSTLIISPRRPRNTNTWPL